MLQVSEKLKNELSTGLFAVLILTAGILYCLPDEQEKTKVYKSENGAEFKVVVNSVSNDNLTYSADDTGQYASEENRDVSSDNEFLKDILPTDAVLIPPELISDAEPKKININTAGKSELMKLPGVGSSKAESIIRYREEHGLFKDITEIMNVSGIKDASFEKIKELICTE